MCSGGSISLEPTLASGPIVSGVPQKLSKETCMHWEQCFLRNPHYLPCKTNKSFGVSTILAFSTLKWNPISQHIKVTRGSEGRPKQLKAEWKQYCNSLHIYFSKCLEFTAKHIVVALYSKCGPRLTRWAKTQIAVDLLRLMQVSRKCVCSSVID